MIKELKYGWITTRALWYSTIENGETFALTLDLRNNADTKYQGEIIDTKINLET